MTEPKYVKISEELRDRLLEKLTYKHVDETREAQACSILKDELRSAPSVETLDLGKVESVIQKWVENYCVNEQTKDFGPGLFFTENCLTDLQEGIMSLTKPEQSGVTVVGDEYYLIRHAVNMTSDEGMSDPLSEEEIETVHAIRKYLKSIASKEQSGRRVTREEIESMFDKWMKAPNADGEDGIICVVGPKNRTQLINFIEALQLPTPPIQASEARGVDLSGVKTWMLTEAQIQEIAAFGYDWADESGLEENYPGCSLLSDAVPVFLAHLQQAPQGVSVPTWEQIAACGIAEMEKMRKTQPGYAYPTPMQWSDIAKSIVAILTNQPPKDKP